MSSVSVIVGIIVLLVALVAYAFAAQTIQHKREQRKRLLAALKSQARSFQFILSGCPEGFLSRELKTLVLRSLIDVCEQLSRLEPKENVHIQNIQVFNDQLAQTQRDTGETTAKAIESPQQIKEIKMSLEELHRYIHSLEQQARLNKAQADGFRAQIRLLVLQVTVDGYVINGEIARQSGKARLAQHYYELARRLLERDGKPGQKEDKLARFDAIIEELMAAASEEEAEAGTSDEDAELQAELDQEWDKFANDNEDIWKKKQVYD